MVLVIVLVDIHSWHPPKLPNIWAPYLHKIYKTYSWKEVIQKSVRLIWSAEK